MHGLCERTGPFNFWVYLSGGTVVSFDGERLFGAAERIFVSPICGDGVVSVSLFEERKEMDE